MTMREPDFAGTWYPAEKSGVLEAFARFEGHAVDRTIAASPVAGVVPHAGWVFSGHLAYNVVRELSRGQRPPDTVVLFGGHLHPAARGRIMPEGDFWTPLGPMPTDEELAQALVQAHGLDPDKPERHVPDNTTELQAPFLKHFFPEAKLVVIAAPPNRQALELAQSVAATAKELGRRLVLVGSTDLTHYGPNYGFSPKGHGAAALRWVKDDNDQRFIDRAVGLQTEALIDEALERSNACCPGAAAAALAGAKALGATTAELLQYATSADIRPDDSFVGYGALIAG